MKHFLRLSILLSLFWLAGCQKDDDSGDDNILSNNLSTGSSAREILSADHFENLVLEIQYPEGFAPTQGSVGDLVDFLKKYCNKPGGISVVSSEIDMPAQDNYTVEEIRKIEDEHRTKFNSGKELAIYIFMAGGNYKRDSNSGTTLGIAYRNTSFAVFQKPIRENSGGLTRPSARLLTSAIFQHEAGHLMGLVNIGSTMQTDHEDTDHEKHCDDEDCLMYWAINNASSVAGLLGGSSPPDLDGQCKADLKANGGR